MTQTLLLVLLAIAVSEVICNPTNGDIRLVDGDGRASGRLEIFMNGVWGTVCYDHTATSGGQGAARAACRQLGFSDYLTVGNVTKLDFPLGTGDILLGSVYCYGDNNLNDATQHILRCSYSTNPSASVCTHGDDMAITCDITSKYVSPYDSEVRLTGGDFPSNGVLEVYLNNEWGTVCSEYFSTSAAHTVCRQMGYTESTDHSFTTDSAKRIWLSDVTCATGSVQCLSLCFNYPSYSYQPPCSLKQRSVVNCTFDTTDPPSAGYGSLCVDYLNLVSHLVAIIVGAMVVVLVFLFLIILIPVVVCCCCIPGCVMFGARERRVVYETL